MNFWLLLIVVIVAFFLVFWLPLLIEWNAEKKHQREVELKKENKFLDSLKEDK